MRGTCNGSACKLQIVACIRGICMEVKVACIELSVWKSPVLNCLF